MFGICSFLIIMKLSRIKWITDEISDGAYSSLNNLRHFFYLDNSSMLSSGLSVQVLSLMLLLRLSLLLFCFVIFLSFSDSYRKFCYLASYRFGKTNARCCFCACYV